MKQDIVVWAKLHPGYVFLWAMFVAMIYPLWQWREASALDHWCKGKQPDEVAVIRQEFDRDTKLAESFWKAVWGIYTLAGIMGLALDKKSKDQEQPGQPPPAQVAPAQARQIQP